MAIQGTFGAYHIKRDDATSGLIIGSSGELKLNPTGPLRVNGSNQIEIEANSLTADFIDTSILDGVLATKLTGKRVQHSLINNPSATTVDIKTALGFGSAAGVDPEGSSKGKCVLLEASGGAEFDTDDGVVGASAQTRSSLVFVRDALGSEIVDENGKEVWAVITASARTTGGSYTLRFYSGDFGSGTETPYTMGEDFVILYPEIFDLSDMPTWSDGVTFTDQSAAQLAPDQIKKEHIDWTDALGNGLQESGGKAVAKPKSGDVIVVDGDGISVSVGSTLTKSGGNLGVADGGIGATQLATAVNPVVRDNDLLSASFVKNGANGVNESSGYPRTGPNLTIASGIVYVEGTRVVLNGSETLPSLATSQAAQYVFIDASGSLSVNNSMNHQSGKVRLLRINDTDSSGRVTAQNKVLSEAEATRSVGQNNIQDRAVKGTQLGLRDTFRQTLTGQTTTSMTLTQAVPSGYEKACRLYRDDNIVHVVGPNDTPSGNQFKVSGTTITLGTTASTGQVFEFYGPEELA